MKLVLLIYYNNKTENKCRKTLKLYVTSHFVNKKNYSIGKPNCFCTYVGT